MNQEIINHSRMNQARSEEEEKERKRDSKDRGQEVDGKEGSPTKKKKTLEELKVKQGLHAQLKLKLGEECPTPLATECDLCPKNMLIKNIIYDVTISGT